MLNLPPCARCQKSDRMTPAGTYPTDFGASVTFHVCRRCGVVAVQASGRRNPYNDCGHPGCGSYSMADPGYNPN